MSYQLWRQPNGPWLWGLTRALGAGLGCDARMSRTAAILGAGALTSLTVSDDLC